MIVLDIMKDNNTYNHTIYVGAYNIFFKYNLYLVVLNVINNLKIKRFTRITIKRTHKNIHTHTRTHKLIYMVNNSLEII